ncbi:MBOAT, membrane-bound O-acyltransferase family-domain-containing protein [Phlebopus sp. FC_14]|nr:MBOAT, membrane-bound O-acyltransferase family-domain-containing protein [Phlebopus sp. FC_14]
MPTDLHTPKSLPSSLQFEQHDTSDKFSKGITSLTVDIPDSNKYQQLDGVRPLPRWRTPEFLFYYVVAAVVIPYMAWVPISLSSPAHVNYPYYRKRLSQGWILGREVDNSDSQYRAFRNNVSALFFLALIYLSLKSIYSRSATRSSSIIPKDNLHHVPFTILFSILHLIGLHGTSTIKIFVILTANYGIGKVFGGSRLGPLITWVFNAIVIFTNERNAGYRFSDLHPSLAGWDTFEGLYPRWHISFNITMLRLVSFNMDYFWACPESALTEKQRAATPHPLDQYSYANYLAYVLFPPLYIAGPIVTFNNFMWQLRRPLDIPWRTVLGYLMRFLICFLTMEFILHFMYMVSIKDTKAWYGDTPLELSMIGFWNLIIVWLKLLLPWRFFRLWSLASGIDAPENMVRCMANNYSTLGFWRSWHRSYNLWIVRYIYIPLGGTKNVVATTVLVFSFVALWHDLSFRLLAWGWLYGRHAWYRHVCALGGVLNILMMISANLVGFVIGTEGVGYMINEMMGLRGLRFLIAACSCLFVGVQLMFEYREEEMRRGIFRRC